MDGAELTRSLRDYSENGRADMRKFGLNLHASSEQWQGARLAKVFISTPTQCDRLSPKLKCGWKARPRDGSRHLVPPPTRNFSKRSRFIQTCRQVVRDPDAAHDAQ